MVVNGRKFYATGALLAHIVQVVAVDDAGNGHLIFVDRETPGLTVINDWSSFGRRTTASGSVVIDNVRVPADRVVPTWKAFDRPTAAGPISRIIQAAIDAGTHMLHDPVRWKYIHIGNSDLNGVKPVRDPWNRSARLEHQRGSPMPATARQRHFEATPAVARPAPQAHRITSDAET